LITSRRKTGLNLFIEFDVDEEERYEKYAANALRPID
jgi:hypothetical protein